MTKQRVLLLVAVVVILISLVLIFRRVAPRGSQDLLGLNVVGEVAAEETTRLLNGRGRVVMIYFEPKGSAKAGNEFVRQAFERKLREMEGIQLVATEVIPVPAESASRQAAELVRKHAGVDVVILVGGLLNVPATDAAEAPPRPADGAGPRLTEPMEVEDFVSLPRPLPRIVSVLTFGAENTKRLLEEGIVTVAIENPYYPVPMPHAIHNARDLFDSLYVVVSSNNIAALQLNPLPDVTGDSAR